MERIFGFVALMGFVFRLLYMPRRYLGSTLWNISRLPGSRILEFSLFSHRSAWSLNRRRMTIYVIFTETDALVSKKSYASWREIHGEYEDDQASLGPWSADGATGKTRMHEPGEPMVAIAAEGGRCAAGCRRRRMAVER
jgi:hypothetical protein